MINLILIIILTFVFLFTTILTLIYLDSKNKPKNQISPFISFIIPTYNDEKYIGDTIKSIYKSYNKNKFEILIVNDSSTDNTTKVLKDLKKKYSFTLINNKENKGKVKSLNDNFKLTKGEIIITIDSDSKITKEAIKDILERFSRNENTAAVGCKYESLDKGTFPLLQEVDYNMQSFILAACNIKSTLSLLGGCIAVRRKALEKVNYLTPNAITEDLDLALKLNAQGYKVEHSFYPLYTRVPTNVKGWYKQKIRWSSGFAQCFLNYYPVYFKHPIFLPLILIYIATAIMFTILGAKGNVNPISLLNLDYNAIKTALTITIINCLALIPYTIPMIRKKSQIPRLLLVIPFALVYFPVYSIVLLIGWTIGIYKYFTLKESEAGWKKE